VYQIYQIARDITKKHFGIFFRKHYITRCSAIAERPRCRVRFSFGQKWKTGTGKQYFTDSVGLSSTIVTSSASKSIEFREKTQNRGYYGVQGHSKSSRSVPIESPYAISYSWLIVIDVVSRTVSELSQLFVQISDIAFLSHHLGDLRTTYDVHLGLIGKRVVDFPLVLIEFFSIGVTAESLRAKIDRKSAISLQSGHFDSKFQVDGVAPHQPFLHR